MSDSDDELPRTEMPLLDAVQTLVGPLLNEPHNCPQHTAIWAAYKCPLFLAIYDSI